MVYLPLDHSVNISTCIFIYSYIFQIIVFGEEDGCISFESLVDPKHGDYVTPECDVKTMTAALLSSSGTTGFPKAVKLPHFGIVANIMQIK